MYRTGNISQGHSVYITQLKFSGYFGTDSRLGLNIESSICLKRRFPEKRNTESEPGVGTKVTAEFQLSNIDRMPLGDITGTIHQLVIYHPNTDFVYKYVFNGNSFTMDTREFREILGDVPFDTKEVSDYIKEYLSENKYNTDNGKNI